MKALALLVGRAPQIVAWCVTLGICVGGFIGIVQPMHARLRATLQQTQQLDERDAENRRILNHASAMGGVRDRVRMDIKRWGGANESGSAFLVAWNDIVQQASVKQIELRSFVRGKDSSRDGIVTREPISITVLGSFEHIMRYVSDISRQRALIEVDDIHLTSVAQSPEVHPLVSATIALSLDRIAKPKRS